MIKEPKVFRQFLTPKEVANYRQMIAQFKQSPDCKVDTDYFYRKYVYNHESLVPFHKYTSILVSKLIQQEIQPTYSFVSMYGEGQGHCPLHLDLQICQLTVDICIDHKQPWPLYVNHTSPYRSDEDLVLRADEIKRESVEYILEPGDALFYSGTDHPHWRNKIQPDNFCDLIFFHFNLKA